MMNVIDDDDDRDNQDDCYEGHNDQLIIIFIMILMLRTKCEHVGLGSWGVHKSQNLKVKEEKRVN